MLEPVLSNPWVRAVAVLLALVLLGALVYILKPILIPLFLAFLVAYVFDPVVDYFERRKVSRRAAIAVLAFFGLAGLLCVPLVVIPSVYYHADKLSSPESEVVGSVWLDRVLDLLPIEQMAASLDDDSFVPADSEMVDSIVEPAEAADAGEETPDKEAASIPAPTSTDVEEEEEPASIEDLTAREVVARYIGEAVRKSAVHFVATNMSTFAVVGRDAGANLFSIFAYLGSGLVQIVLFVANVALFAFVAIYLLRDFDGLVRGARELIPPKYEAKTVSIVSQIDAQLRSFLRGQITVCFCLGAMYAVGFLIARTPFAILIAAFGIVVSFIPFLGVTMVAIVAVTLTILQYGLDWHILVVIATIGIAQALEGNVLTPKIVGDQVGLNPVWVILAILVFGNFLGFLGLLLAVPIAAALKVLVLEGVAYYRKSPVFTQDQA